MSETRVNSSPRQISIRHRGRGAQVLIYFGKLLRMFLYQNDWKVLPMAALIAGLVGMVTRKSFFVNMEGSLMGSFAVVCVCIWNGCFNSIQVICRERDVIKREHRSGMHISSYIASHMMYQALLCLAQTLITQYVTSLVGVQYPSEGLITSSFFLDFMLSMFLITFASDMLSLWVSALAHNTTTAMTIMPFVLIFQLVFSGGMLTLPEWTRPMTYFTLSNPGLKVLAAQADTNHRPYATISKLVGKMRDSEINASVTIGQVLGLLQQKENPAVAELRARELGRELTLGEVMDALEGSSTFAALKQEPILEDVTLESALQTLLQSDAFSAVTGKTIPLTGMTLETVLRTLLSSEEAKPLLAQKLLPMSTLGDLLDTLNVSGLMEKYRETAIDASMTVGELVDLLASNEDVRARWDTPISLHTNLGYVLDLVGEERIKSFLEGEAARASYVADYELTPENIFKYWSSLIAFIFIFALLAMVTLEFIDKDKR